MSSPPSSPELLLILGDVHIPGRIGSVPEEIKKILDENKGKFSRILCTGNYGTQETILWLKSLLPEGKKGNFNCVKSDFQESGVGEGELGGAFPESLVVKSNSFSIGLINGYQIVPWGDLSALNSLSKQLCCDILVSGFTHINGVYNYEGKWLINPGTLTGAFSPLNNNPDPCFMTILTVGEEAVLYKYQYNLGSRQFEVTKISLVK